MSIIEMITRRRPRIIHEREPQPFDLRPGAVNRFNVSENMMDELDRALEDQRLRTPLGTPTPRPRTAQVIADEIAHLRHELTNARELVKAGEAKEATLVAELGKTIDEELAVKKATHDTEVAELESLRPTTGEQP